MQNCPVFTNKYQNPQTPPRDGGADCPCRKRRPGNRSRNKEQPESALPDIERKQRDSRRQRKAEQQIAEQGDPRQRAPQRGQRGIQDRRRDPEAERRDELSELKRNGDAHPNSRERKPPSCLASS